MKFSTTAFELDPQSIAEADYNCLWLDFYGYDLTSGILHPALQVIDWKLRGEISRCLAIGIGSGASGTAGEFPVFIPSQGRLKASFVALWLYDAVLPDSLKRCTQGQQWKSLLYFCTAPGRWDKVKSVFQETGEFGVDCVLTQG